MSTLTPKAVDVRIDEQLPAQPVQSQFAGNSFGNGGTTIPNPGTSGGVRYYLQLADATTVNLPAVNVPLALALAALQTNAGVHTYSALTDAATVDLPVVNTPLAQALTNLNSSLTTAINSAVTTVNLSISNLSADVATKVNRAGDTMLGSLLLAQDPSSVMEAATKRYVDAQVAAGSTRTWKDPVRVATTANLNWPLQGLPSIDTVQLVEGDRVLVKNQTLPWQNGVFIASGSSVWQRAADFKDGSALNSASSISTGCVFYVNEGGQRWQAFVMSTVGAITVDTSSVVFTSFNNNQLIVLGGDAGGSGTTSIPVTLTPSGAAAGTYHSVVVNSKGLVTSGTNPTTLSGFGITDGVRITGDTMTGFLTLVGDPVNPLHPVTKQYFDQATSGAGFTVIGGLSLNASKQLAVSTADVTRIVVNANNIDLATTAVLPGTYNNVTVDAYGRVTAGAVSGNATITLSGDATGAGTAGIAVTLAASGVTAGTYKSVTVDAKGRVTSGSNPTTLAGYGITDAVAKNGDIMSGPLAMGTSDTVSASNSRITRAADPVNPQDLATKVYVDTIAGGVISPGDGLAFTGNVLNVVPISNTRLVVTTGTIDLATSGASAGTYSSVTVDTYGRVTAGSNPTPVLSVSLNGDATGSGNTGTAIPLTLANVTTAGTARNKFDVDAKGRILSSTTETTLAGLGVSDSIGALNDVTVAAPANNQVLTYSAGQWVNATPAAATDKLAGVSATDSSPGYLFNKLGFSPSFTATVLYPGASEALGVELSQPPTLTGGATYGYQTVNTGGTAVATTATGFVAGTTYTATVTVDSTLYNLSILGADATTYLALISQINAVLGVHGTATLNGGNLRVTSASAGALSTVAIVNTGGNPLFSTLPGYVSIPAATNGVSSGTYNTFDVDVYGRVINASNLAGTNQPIALSGDATGTGSTAITVTLASSGVAAGVYTQVTVDGKGRVTLGANPTTLAGYGITDAQPLGQYLTSLHNLNANGIIIKQSGGAAGIR